ncbi:MAG: NAD(P)-binding domain-containing protein [Chloroflexi bacterium]|nr:NAD(P)-binding domain-containing protein [Chloroflexota bacterium]
MAGLSPADDRPFPPGEYPLVIVGSGPGAIQLSYALRAAGVQHAIVGADAAPGGMFLKWPFFQRLLSWTKPYAPAEHATRTYERFDWNSLIADEPDAKALMPTFMDGTSYFPSRPEMEQNLKAFVQRTGLQIRLGCRWTATRRVDGPNGPAFILETTDGEYRTPLAVFAVGIAEPYSPPLTGGELCAHYAMTRSPESYADRRVFIIGKSVSAFELATGLLQWARGITLASPSPTKLSVNTRSLVGVRARYVQPFEDHVLGGGVTVLDAQILSVERDADGGYVVVTRSGAEGDEMRHAADDVISATGFISPLQDLPALGVATFGPSRLPAQTPFWESATVPGIYFAGTITQASGGLKKHGLPSNSGAVHGARYNARVLARHIAETRAGITFERPSIAPGELLEFVIRDLNGSPELWHQKAYLARVLTVSGDEGLRDEGLLPLAHVVDTGGPDAIVLTLEADGSGATYPVLYLRRGGKIEEHALEPEPMMDFSGPVHRRQLADVLGRLVPLATAG